MCGRFTQFAEPTELEKTYHKKVDFKYRGPNYNVAPTQNVAIVTQESIIQARFGLIPVWAKDLNTGYTMINAKAETVLEKPTYKGLFRHSRCLIPATGFYEWLNDNGVKRPHFFTLKDRTLFSFAGLYSVRKDAEDRDFASFTIITTTPNTLVGKVHDRMPVILTKEDEKDWLNIPAEDAEALLSLLKPYPASKMQAVEVSSLVNKASAENSAALIQPV